MRIHLDKNVAEGFTALCESLGIGSLVDVET
jgi:hypothetical protein